jgi:thiol-disulfide isomerase/thioredoxin
VVVRRLSWLLIGAVVALAGCAGDPEPAGAPGGDPPAATPAGSLLDFTATTIDGGTFDGASLAGRPAVLWFWAPWCPVCLGQAPGVRQAVEQYADQVPIVGVAGLDTAAAMPEFVRLARVEGMPHIVDEAGDVWRRFEVTAQSTFVLIDADGEITFRGRLGADEVPDRVAALLG